MKRLYCSGFWDCSVPCIINWQIIGWGERVRYIKKILYVSFLLEPGVLLINRKCLVPPKHDKGKEDFESCHKKWDHPSRTCTDTLGCTKGNSFSSGDIWAMRTRRVECASRWSESLADWLKLKPAASASVFGNNHCPQQGSHDHCVYLALFLRCAPGWTGARSYTIQEKKSGYEEVLFFPSKN